MLRFLLHFILYANCALAFILKSLVWLPLRLLTPSPSPSPKSSIHLSHLVSVCAHSDPCRMLYSTVHCISNVSVAVFLCYSINYDLTIVRKMNLDHFLIFGRFWWLLVNKIFIFTKWNWIYQKIKIVESKELKWHRSHRLI